MLWCGVNRRLRRWERGRVQGVCATAVSGGVLCGWMSGGALPGRVGVAEVGLAARSEGEAGVLGHLDALGPR